jgi:hypothetical protein
MRNRSALSFHPSAAAHSSSGSSSGGWLGVGAAASTTTTIRTYSLFIKLVGKGVTVNEHTREEEKK